MKSCALASRAAATICSSVGVRRAERDVLAHGDAEQHALLEHDGDLRAQRGERDVAQVVAVEQDPPVASGRTGAGAGETSVDLPAPDGPDERHARAGGHLEVDAEVERRPAPPGS